MSKLLIGTFAICLSLGTAVSPAHAVCGHELVTQAEQDLWNGGSDGDQKANDVPGSAGLYDSESDTWTSVPRSDGPENHSLPALAWTGTHVIAVGKRSVVVPHGRAFSVKDNKWLAMPSGFNARAMPTACWANGKLYLWGGSIGDGDRVDGTVDIWTPPVASE